MRHVLGIAVVALLALAVARAQSVPQATPKGQAVQPAPDPRTMVIVREEDGPYSVPQGGRLIVYALGAVNSANSYMNLMVDGRLMRVSGQFSTSVQEIPPFPVDDTLEIDDYSSSNGVEFTGGIAFGYLVREN